MAWESGGYPLQSVCLPSGSLPWKPWKVTYNIHFLHMKDTSSAHLSPLAAFNTAGLSLFSMVMTDKQRFAQSCWTLQPHKLQPARLLCPWNSPGKNIRVGCHSFLQGIFPPQGLNLGLSHCRQILYHLSHTLSLFLHQHHLLLFYLHAVSSASSHLPSVHGHVPDFHSEPLFFLVFTSFYLIISILRLCISSQAYVQPRNPL